MYLWKPVIHFRPQFDNYTNKISIKYQRKTKILLLGERKVSYEVLFTFFTVFLSREI